MTKTADYFPDFVNSRAFIDRIVLNVKDSRRPVPLADLRRVQDKGIKSAKSRYARCWLGTIVSTGNAVQLKYGPIFPYLPKFRLILIAGAHPLLSSDIQIALHALFVVGAVGQISEVELTFDVENQSGLRLRQNVFSRARMHCPRKGGEHIFYWGTRNSNWQLRMYEKGTGIVRVEFILRRPFLRLHGIEHVADLHHLRRLPVWDRIRFREFDATALRERGSCEWKIGLTLDLVRWGAQVQELESELRRFAGGSPGSLSADAPIQSSIENMQRGFLW